MNTLIIALVIIIFLLIAAVGYIFFNDVSLKDFKAPKENLLQKEIIALRIQAYERVALFLERIRPTALVRRISTDNSIEQYEYLLIDAIQSEYEHNIAQQVYINPETWKVVFSAKNATQNFISECSKNVGKEGTAKQLQEEIIKQSMNREAPTSQAMLYLQTDVQRELK